MDNIEQLKEYRKKLCMLSEEEKKLRDLYLKKISEGSLQRPMTGFPSLDKPWLKYYEEKKLDMHFEHKTVYEMIYDNNKESLQNLAIEFFGMKITYKTFFKKVQQVAVALKNYGIKKGDYVTVCLAGIPETAYIFYALSMLGAIGNFLPPYLDQDSMIQNINLSKSKIAFVMDSFYQSVNQNFQKTSIEKVVIVDALNSSYLKFFSKKEKIKKTNNCVSWNEFTETTKNKNIIPIEYESNLPLAVVYSSGTNGNLKGIILSNDSFQNSVSSYLKSGVEIEKKRKMYQVIPPWSSTGLSTALHLPLSVGSSVFMDPRYDKNIFVRNVINHKINYVIATTSMYSSFFNEKSTKNKKWPHLIYPFEGGEYIDEKNIERIEKNFRTHENSSKLRVGYGQCECGATIATETANTKHNIGSVGIPLPDINIKILDDNNREVYCGERGRVMISSPCSMLGYFQNEKLTEKYFNYDENGLKWNNTEDIGHIDSDGNLFIDGRSRDFAMINGKKIYNFDIEKIIMEMENIKECEVLPKVDLAGDSSIAVHIILENDEFISQEDINILLEKIQKRVYETMNDLDAVPYIFKIRKEFPHAKSSKRDIKKIQLENDNFIYIDKFNPCVKKLCKSI